jgi:hypothetical protein
MPAPRKYDQQRQPTMAPSSSPCTAVKSTASGRRLPATVIGSGEYSHPARDVYRPRTTSNASSSWGCGAVSGGMLCSAMNFIMVGTS